MSVVLARCVKLHRLSTSIVSLSVVILPSTNATAQTLHFFYPNTITNMHQLKRPIALLLLGITGLLIFNQYSVRAQDKPPMSLGLNGGLNFNFHGPTFKLNSANALATNPYNYETSAMGLGGAIGLSFIYPFSYDYRLAFRMGYNSLFGSLTSNTKAVAGVTPYNQKLDGSIAMWEISPTMHFHNILGNNPLYLIGGLELGLPLSASYTSTMTIDSTATTNTDANVTEGGDIPNAGFRFALLAGLGYDLDLAKGIHLQPELTFRFPFTKVSSSPSFDSWNVPQLRLGVGLMFDLGSATEEKRPEPPKDNFVEASFKRIIAFTPQGDTVDVRQVKVEDIQYSELYPLVPYIFFPQNSKSVDSTVSIPRKRETGDNITDITELKDGLRVNGTILDVVCARMKKYETAKLTIVGTNDGKTELKNKNLSKERAEQIRDYLVECGVSPDRLIVSSRDMPEKASSSNVADGIAENRRVELKSDMPEILEPVVSKQELEQLADPDIIEFMPEFKSSDPVINWNLELSQAGRTIRNIPGLSDPKPVRWKINPGDLSNQQVPVDYSYTIENARGAKKTVNGSIPVDYISSIKKKQEKLADRTVDKFSLILFDFDSDVLTPDNQRILELKVLNSIKYNSIVKVIGSTDRIGDDKYNKQLSLRRATSVMNALKAKRQDVKYEVYGAGEKEVYDNNMPTGRQLSRTVQIIVETPR